MAKDSGAAPGPAVQALLVALVAGALLALGWLASLVWPGHGPWAVLALALAVLLVRLEVWGRTLVRRPRPGPLDASPAVLEMSRRLQELTAAVERRERDAGR